MVLLGVLQGVSPSLEEAVADPARGRWRTFSTVTWPLIRPGLANAFLIGFIESLADFANPRDRRQLQCASTRSFSQWSARRMTRVAPRCWPSCCWLHAGRVPGAARLARPAQLRDVGRKGPYRHPAALPGRCALAAIAVVVPVADPDRRGLWRHPGRRVRRAVGRDNTPTLNIFGRPSRSSMA